MHNEIKVSIKKKCYFSIKDYRSWTRLKIDTNSSKYLTAHSLRDVELNYNCAIRLWHGWRFAQWLLEQGHDRNGKCPQQPGIHLGHLITEASLFSSNFNPRIEIYFCRCRRHRLGNYFAFQRHLLRLFPQSISTCLRKESFHLERTGPNFYHCVLYLQNLCFLVRT